MAKPAVRFSDKLESEMIQLVGTILLGLGVMIFCGVWRFFMHYLSLTAQETSNNATWIGVSGGGVIIAIGFYRYALLHHLDTVVVGLTAMIFFAIVTYVLNFWGSDLNDVARMFTSACVGGGAVVSVAGVYRHSLLRNLERIPVPCPYCGVENILAEAPSEDFDCEHCNRTVHFQDGLPIPVRNVVCDYCHTSHRVGVNIYTYVCDRCNRPLRLRPDPKYNAAAERVREVVPADRDDLLQNFDVLLVAFDRRRENDVAFKLQNLLFTDLREARRLLKTASTRTPLVVGLDLPPRKAEVIRRSLQDLGATASLRPTNVRAAAAQRPR